MKAIVKLNMVFTLIFLALTQVTILKSAEYPLIDGEECTGIIPDDLKLFVGDLVHNVRVVCKSTGRTRASVHVLPGATLLSDVLPAGYLGSAKATTRSGQDVTLVFFKFGEISPTEPR